MFAAACRPCCMATGRDAGQRPARPGAGRRRDRRSRRPRGGPGWRGRARRSTRPARSSGTPSDFASGDAATPAAQTTVRARCARRRAATPSASSAGHRAPVRTSTPRARELLRRRARSSSRSTRRGCAGRPSTRTMRASRGSMRAEVADEDVAGDLGDRAGELDAGRAAAHDHEGEQLPARARRRARARPSRTRAGCGGGSRGRPRGVFRPGAYWLPLVVAEVGVAGARGDDQVVVGERAVGEDDLVGAPGRSRVTSASRTSAFAWCAQDRADRVGDVGRARGRPSRPGRAAAGRDGGCAGRRR